GCGRAGARGLPPVRQSARLHGRRRRRGKAAPRPGLPLPRLLGRHLALPRSPRRRHSRSPGTPIMQDLRVSENRRFLVRADGTPFFYLADTAWELFHRLDFEQAEDYLENRAAKGFTVIQAVALAEFDGLTEPNANGDLPLIDQDPARPNAAYFEHVDR